MAVSLNGISQMVCTTSEVSTQTSDKTYKMAPCSTRHVFGKPMFKDIEETETIVHFFVSVSIISLLLIDIITEAVKFNDYTDVFAYVSVAYT